MSHKVNTPKNPPINPITPTKLDSSFAISFKSMEKWHNLPLPAGIGYLKNGNIFPTNGTASMGEVRDSAWYCVTILWNKHVNNAGGDMMTYVNGVLRKSEYYPTLGDLVTGTSPYNPMVTVGMTSGTKGCRNTHLIQFVSMENNITPQYVKLEHTLTTNLHINTGGGIPTGHHHFMTFESITFCGKIITSPYYFVYDTLQLVNEPLCFNYEEGNYDNWLNYITFSLQFEMEIIDTNREWSYLKDSVYVPMPYTSSSWQDILKLDSVLKYFLTNKHLDTFFIRWISFGDTMYFTIPFYNTFLFRNYFLEHFGDNAVYIPGDFTIYDTLKITLDSLDQFIKLPLLDSCSYNTTGIDSSMFDIVPEIIGLPDSAVLNFRFLDTCGISTSLKISLDCFCISPLNLVINAPACPPCIDLSFHEVYSTCEGAKFGILNCGNPEIPSVVYKKSVF